MNQKDHKTLPKLFLTEEEREEIARYERREMLIELFVVVWAIAVAVLLTVLVMEAV